MEFVPEEELTGAAAGAAGTTGAVGAALEQRHPRLLLLRLHMKLHLL